MKKIFLTMVIFMMTIGMVIADDFNYDTPGYGNAPWNSTKSQVLEHERDSYLDKDWGPMITYLEGHYVNDADDVIVASYYTYHFLEGLLLARVEYADSFYDRMDMWYYVDIIIDSYTTVYGEPVTWTDEENEDLDYYTWHDGDIIFKVFSTKLFYDYTMDIPDPFDRYAYYEIAFNKPGLSSERLEFLDERSSALYNARKYMFQYWKYYEYQN